MAKSKKSKKRKKSSKKRISVFTILLTIILVVAVGAFGFLSVQKMQPFKEKMDLISAQFKLLPSEVTEPISFFDVEEVNGKWIVDEKYFPTLQTLNRPTYKEGDKTTTIVLECDLGLNPFDELINNYLGIIKETKLELKIKIIALPITNEEAVNEFINNLDIPNSIYTNIGLSTSSVVYEGLECTWQSSNQAVINNNGEVLGSGESNLTCKVTLGDYSIEKIYPVTVKNPEDIVIVDTDFADYEDSSYINKENFNGLLIENGLADNEKLKMRAKSDSNGVILSGSVKGLKEISFSYEYHSSSKGNSYTKNSYLELLYSVDGSSYLSLKKETLNDSNKHDFNYLFDGKNGFIKIIVSTEYSEKFIIIDDFRLTRNFNSDDVIIALKNTLPKKVKSNCDMPFTTPYGGVVSYQSQNSSFSNLGVVSQTNEKQEVVLKVVVTGFDFEVKFDYTITILGLNQLSPVEIRFIDVGKYGASDCGESIYIKLDTIDVLIDAGDRYDTTYPAVKECIEAYSEDRVLDYIIATHPDSDHIGGMDNVILDFEVKNIITFTMFDTDTSGVFKAYRDAVNNEGAKVCTGTESVNNLNGCNKIITLADDVFIEILDTKHYEDKGNNPRSIVCVLNAYGTRVLFTGDADNHPKNIEDDYKDQVGNIDILKLVHHGTQNGTTASFVAAIDPEVGIITNGNYLGNKHGHPTYPAIEAMYQYDENMKIYAVAGGKGDNCELGTSYLCPSNGDVDNRFYQRNGMITILIDNNGYSITSEYNGDNLIEIKNTDFYKSYQAALGK